MKTFDELWADILERCERFQFPLVQDKEELRYIYNLISNTETLSKNGKSLLEIGTAEGNSLYVLAHALGKEPWVEVIDFGEKHTYTPRQEILDHIEKEFGTTPRVNYGNSHDLRTYTKPRQYDFILIDAGHSYEDVIADVSMYGHLATKYIFFHDIQLPPVKAAYDWYLKQNPQFKHHEFINSTTFGYGILEI